MPASRTAFVGGKVWTPGYGAPRELDVLVAEGRIIRVARSGELDATATRVVDTTGQLLIPGFQDAHVHPEPAGADLLTCNLSDQTTEQGVLDRIEAYSATLPDDAWVVGGGWDREVFARPGPTRQQLDAVTAGRPAFLRSFDCHGAWVNSAALLIAGVDADTVDPEHGFVVRDGDGKPTGMLEERAMAIVRRHMPPETTGDQKRALVRAQDHLLTLGLTSVQDAIVGGGLGIPDQIPAYRDLLTDHTWKCRLTAALWWDSTRGLDQIAELQAKRQALEACADRPWVIADTVKIMVDGADTLFMDRDTIRETTLALDALGFTCHYHSYGELATHWILDAIADARAINGVRGGRHHIAHLMVVSEEDFPRFAELDVTANIQAAWGYSAVMHDIMRLTTGSQDPQLREYAFGRLAAAGARLAAGSDWPVTTADPLEAMRLEVTRGRDRKPTGAEGDPDELDRLDLPTLLTAYTAGSAYVNGRGFSTGRIAAGFEADLAILDRDPFQDNESLRQVAVDQTWIAGECVFSREPAERPHSRLRGSPV
jgi:predicted amidohydrolase YtcJ